MLRESMAPRKAVLFLGLLLLVCILVLSVSRGIVQQANDLYPDAPPAHPYLVFSHAILLYMGMPLVVLASIVVLLAPGVLLVLAFGEARSIEEIALKGFGASFGAHFIVQSGIKWVLGFRAQPHALLAALFAAGFFAWVILLLRGERIGKISSLLLGANSGRRLAWFVVLVLTTVIFLLPIIFWQDFNPDGLEALTMGRSLNSFLLPRLPTGKVSGLGLGMISSAFPIHWFILLVGPIEAAARLPVVLYVPLLFFGLVALVERDSPRPLRASEEAVLALGLSAAVATLAFNVTYHPYSADLASPAGFDILCVCFLVGTLYFFWADEPFWFLLFSVLSYFTRPIVLMVLGLLVLGVLFFSRAQLRGRLRWVILGIVACLLLRVGYEKGFAHLAGVEVEEGSQAILSRLRYLRFDDFRRLLFLCIPSGVLPSFALLFLRQQDPIGRSAAVISLGYFLFFYVLAFIALHHFALAMILPLVVFWRLLLRRPAQWRMVCAACLGAILSLWISLPHRAELDRAMRAIGRETEYRIGDYEGDYGAYRAAFRQKDLLSLLFRAHWEVADPRRERVGAPWVQIHYASRTAKDPGKVNYIVQPLTATPPDGFTRIGSNSVAAVYVKDLDHWRFERFHPPATDFRSFLYAIPRETLFRFWGVPARNYTVDLVLWRDRLRGFVLYLKTRARTGHNSGS